MKKGRKQSKNFKKDKCSTLKNQKKSKKAPRIYFALITKQQLKFSYKKVDHGGQE